MEAYHKSKQKDNKDLVTLWNTTRQFSTGQEFS